MAQRLPELGRYTTADFVVLLRYVLEQAPSEAIEETIANCGQDEFNTIEEAVNVRLDKEGEV